MPRNWLRKKASNGWTRGTRTNPSCSSDHKAPHRCWCPSIQNLGRAKQYADAIDPPANLEDDFADRPEFLKMTEQTLLNHFNVWSDEHLIKEVVPEDIQKMLPARIQDPAYSV